MIETEVPTPKQKSEKNKAGGTHDLPPQRPARTRRSRCIVHSEQQVRVSPESRMMHKQETRQSTTGFTQLLLMFFWNLGEFSGQRLLNVKP
jgi:hypothetical protein